MTARLPKVDESTQAQEIGEKVGEHRPANGSRPPGDPPMAQTDEEGSREKGPGATSHTTGMDGLGGQMPEGKSHGGIEVSPHHLAREDSRIDAAPEHFFADGIDQSQRRRTQRYQGRRSRGVASRKRRAKMVTAAPRAGNSNRSRPSQAGFPTGWAERRKRRASLVPLMIQSGRAKHQMSQ